jgi:hypothetical protein
MIRSGGTARSVHRGRRLPARWLRTHSTRTCRGTCTQTERPARIETVRGRDQGGLLAPVLPARHCSRMSLLPPGSVAGRMRWAKAHPWVAASHFSALGLLLLLMLVLVPWEADEFPGLETRLFLAAANWPFGVLVYGLGLRWGFRLGPPQDRADNRRRDSDPPLGCEQAARATAVSPQAAGLDTDRRPAARPAPRSVTRAGRTIRTGPEPGHLTVEACSERTGGRRSAQTASEWNRSAGKVSN